MDIRKLFFLMLLIIIISAFFYMIAKKTDITGTQRVSIKTFSQWCKEIIQLRNYIRKQAPNTQNLSIFKLDKKIKKAIKKCTYSKDITPTIDNIAYKLKKI